jgi:hypothetical protein
MAMTLTPFSTPSAQPDSRPSQAARPGPEPSKVGRPLSLPGPFTLPRPNPAKELTAVRSRNGKKAKPWWPPRYPGSAEALFLLTLYPVFATPVPRYHVGPRAPDGVLLVHDRATSDRFVAYSPRFIHQFHAGHHAGLWYLRRVTDRENRPSSVGYATARAAVEALRAGGWMLPHSQGARERRATPLRIIWS